MDPSISNQFPTASSNPPDSCENSGTPEIDANINKHTMSSAFVTRPSFPSSSTANLPLTQITNNGGTININYNIDTAPVPRLDKDKASAVDRVGETVRTEHDPELTSPLRPDAESFNGEPASAKSSSEGHATPQDTLAKNTEHLPHRESDDVWGISEDEKAEVRDSIDLILLGSISRKELSEALMNLAEALVLIDDDDMQCAHDDAVQLQTDPASAESCTAWSTGLMCPNPASKSVHETENILEESGLLQAPVKSTPVSSTNESFRDDCSGLSINALSNCEGVPSSQHDVDTDGGNKSAATSLETLVLSKKNFPPLPSASAQGERSYSITVKRPESDLNHS